MDIISLPVEVDKDAVDGKFRLATIAAQRARELSLGAKPRVQTRAKKVTTVAIEEAVNSCLEYIVGDEARKAKQEAKKFDYRKLLEERRREGSESLSELEKDLKVYLHEREAEGMRALEELFQDKAEGSEDMPDDKGAEE
jgi:DNA-directed RNA polymerase subunit omega